MEMCLWLEDHVAISAATIFHSQAAQDANGKKEDGQENGTAAIVVVQITNATVGATTSAVDQTLRIDCYSA